PPPYWHSIRAFSPRILPVNWCWVQASFCTTRRIHGFGQHTSLGITLSIGRPRSQRDDWSSFRFSSLRGAAFAYRVKAELAKTKSGILTWPAYPRGTHARSKV